MSVGLKGQKTSFPEKSGGVNPYKQFFSGRSWLKKLTGKTLDYLKPSAPKATFETPKNLTHADESAIRTWCRGG